MEVSFEIMNDWMKILYVDGDKDDQDLASEWFEWLYGKWQTDNPGSEEE